MVINCLKIAVLRDSYRVEMAGDRFVEIALSFTVCLLDRTLADTIRIIASEDTILAMDNRGHQVALLINISHTLLLDNGLRSRREVIPNERQHRLQLRQLLLLQRSPGITLHAALTLAMRQVAQEATLHYI